MQPDRVLTWLNIILISIGVTNLSCRKNEYVSIRWWWQMINMLFIIYIVASEAVFTFINRQNMILVTVVFITELTCFMDMMKMIFQMVHRDEIKDIIDMLIYEEFALKVPFIKHIMNTSDVGPKAQELKTLMETSKANLLAAVSLCLKVYAFLGYATITWWISLPILLQILYPDEHYRELPFCMLFPWDMKKTPNYHLTYLININAGLFCVSAYVALDCLFAFLIGHIIRQLRLIGFILGNLNQIVSEVCEEYSEEWEGNCITIMSSCAVHFESLRQICKRLNVINKVFFVIQAVCSSILICMCIFKIVFAENRLALEVTTQYYFYVILATIQIGIYCFSGQILINESEQLHDCLMSGWWSHGRRYRSNMRILQAALHQPLTMHIWGSIKVSHVTFGSVVKTSLSYLALLKSVVEKK